MVLFEDLGGFFVVCFVMCLFCDFFESFPVCLFFFLCG